MKKLLLCALFFVGPCMAMNQPKSASEIIRERNEVRDEVAKLEKNKLFRRKVRLLLATTSCCGTGAFLIYIIRRLMEYQSWSDQALLEIIENSTKYD